MAFKDNLHRPPPRWLRIVSGIIGDAEDFVLALMLVLGYAANAPEMLIYKLSSSFVRRQLKRFISNGEVYALEDTKTETVTVTKTETSVDTTETDKVDTSKFPYKPDGDSEIQNK